MFIFILLIIIFTKFSNISLFTYKTNKFNSKNTKHLQLKKLNFQLQMYKECIKTIENKTKKHNFTKILDPEIIIMVNSKPDDYQTRCGIRFSWSHHLNQQYLGIKSYVVIFQLGLNNKYTLNQEKYENSIYHDMFIHENIQDSYSNLTRKNIETWKLIIQNYKNVKYVIKTDSDVYVNIKIYMEHLSQILNLNILYEGLK